MRIVGFLILLCLESPLWAQETSSLRIDLSLYHASPCDNSQNTLLHGPRRPYGTIGTPLTDQPCATIREYPDFVGKALPAWEARTTAWFALSRENHLGIGLDFTTDNKHETFKLRGRRILYERRF